MQAFLIMNGNISIWNISHSLQHLEKEEERKSKVRVSNIYL
jgi:hypothetical protein